MGTPDAEFEPINHIGNRPRRIVTFVNLEMVCSLSFRVTSVDDTNNTISTNTSETIEIKRIVRYKL